MDPISYTDGWKPLNIRECTLCREMLYNFPSIENGKNWIFGRYLTGEINIYIQGTTADVFENNPSVKKYLSSKYLLFLKEYWRWSIYTGVIPYGIKKEVYSNCEFLVPFAPPISSGEITMKYSTGTKSNQYRWHWDPSLKDPNEINLLYNKYDKSIKFFELPGNEPGINGGLNSPLAKLILDYTQLKYFRSIVFESLKKNINPTMIYEQRDLKNQQVNGSSSGLNNLGPNSYSGSTNIQRNISQIEAQSQNQFMQSGRNPFVGNFNFRTEDPTGKDGPVHKIIRDKNGILSSILVSKNFSFRHVVTPLVDIKTLTDIEKEFTLKIGDVISYPLTRINSLKIGSASERSISTIQVEVLMNVLSTIDNFEKVIRRIFSECYGDILKEIGEKSNKTFHNMMVKFEDYKNQNVKDEKTKDKLKRWKLKTILLNEKYSLRLSDVDVNIPKKTLNINVNVDMIEGLFQSGRISKENYCKFLHDVLGVVVETDFERDSDSPQSSKTQSNKSSTDKTSSNVKVNKKSIVARKDENEDDEDDDNDDDDGEEEEDKHEKKTPKEKQKHQENKKKSRKTRKRKKKKKKKNDNVEE